MLSVAILYVIIFVFNFYSSFVLSNDLICQWVETTGYLHDLSGVFVISVRTHLLRVFFERGGRVYTYHQHGETAN